MDEAASPRHSAFEDAQGILTGTLLPAMSQEVLTRMAEGMPVKKVSVGVNDRSQFTYAIE